MLHEKYEPVIGLEVHCQLLTDSKAFSPESAAFGGEPNTHVDPISLGHPGTLPVLNEQVVEHTLRVGLSTHCKIAPHSVFARKHYFYPDLPKGYQISQYDTPICYDGYVEITLEENAGDGEPQVHTKRIGLTRIHLEEDAGKSLHHQEAANTLIDYNRCGVPLIEIVSEPDVRSAREAYRFLRKIRQVVRYLGICDGNMEEGSLRCDANVSVRRRGKSEFGTKTELKNLNSFRHVEQALDYEIARQISVLERGHAVTQQTLLWDENRQETRPMRTKEEEHDYRYFPDPDLVEVEVTDEILEQVRQSLPEMPEERRRRFTEEMALPAYDADVLTEERPVADYFEDALAKLAKLQGGGSWKGQAKAISNVVMTDVLRALNERNLEIEQFPIRPDRLAALVDLRLDDEVGSSAAQKIFNRMLDSPKKPAQIAEEENLRQVSDEGAIAPVVEKVLKEHPDQVQTYLNGKEGLVGFFIGQVMRRFDGSPDPQLVRKLLREKLKAARS